MSLSLLLLVAPCQQFDMHMPTTARPSSVTLSPRRIHTEEHRGTQGEMMREHEHVSGASSGVVTSLTVDVAAVLLVGM